MVNRISTGAFSTLPELNNNPWSGKNSAPTGAYGQSMPGPGLGGMVAWDRQQQQPQTVSQVGAQPWTDQALPSAQTSLTMPKPMTSTAPSASSKFGSSNTAQVAQQGAMTGAAPTPSPSTSGAFASVPAEMRNNPGMAAQWLRTNSLISGSK